MHEKIFLLIIPTFTFFTCSINPNQENSHIKNEIQKELDKCALAVSTKNIDLYMDLIPQDFILRDNSGEIISREKQRKYTVRDWSIIDTTLYNIYTVDSIQNMTDSVMAFTSQKWERLMFQRDGVTKDTIPTTQKHKETWKKSSERWMNYEVKELGGQVFINGEIYTE